MKTLNFFLAVAAVTLVACGSPTGSGGGDDPLNPFAAYHNGTLQAPVSLTLNTPFAGKVGSSEQTPDNPNASHGYESYYKIAGVSADVLAIKITGSDPAHTGTAENDYYYTSLFGPGGLDGEWVGSGGTTDTIWPLFSVSGSNATYGLIVDNYLDANTTYSLTVLADPVVNEGTTTDPIPLTLGEAHSATTSMTGESGSYSYYQFELASPSTVDITYENGQLDATIFAGTETWTGDIQDFEDSHSTNHLQTTLPAGTYSLRMSLFNGVPAMTKYSLKVEVLIL